jgi:hypothetical protein
VVLEQQNREIMEAMELKEQVTWVVEEAVEPEELEVILLVRVVVLEELVIHQILVEQNINMEPVEEVVHPVKVEELVEPVAPVVEVLAVLCR